MRIEQDEVTVLAGVRGGITTGAPIVLQIQNRDSRLEDAPAVHRPRPGHADLAGAIKWLTSDCRNTLERASARETAARTACGALARGLLAEFGIRAAGFVTRIGSVACEVDPTLEIEELARRRDASQVYCPDEAAGAAMIEAIRAAKIAKDTLGGVIEVRIEGVPIGLGSCGSWQAKLDGRLMQAIGSIQAIKGVEIGLGFAAAALPGSLVHDAIHFDPSRREEASLGFVRPTNRAGGLEGGMTNGAPIVVRAAMKPISTLLQGMESIDLRTREQARSDYERSDICAVPAASVVAENVAAFEVARAMLEKFGGDTSTEVRAAYLSYCDAARRV